ncbi:MAG: hypothetical protein ACLRVU_01215 [Beduini sp.]|uniref:hypothetical protein n=1 Tax=Beduini sp. TaxID=1922300 RepID=UPI0039A06092
MIEGEQETQNLGLTNFINGTIHIDKNLSASIFKKILIHEMVHACLFSYGHFNENYSQEELCDIVAFLGPVIFEKASNVLGFFKDKN